MSQCNLLVRAKQSEAVWRVRGLGVGLTRMFACLMLFAAVFFCVTGPREVSRVRVTGDTSSAAVSLAFLVTHRFATPGASSTHATCIAARHDSVVVRFLTAALPYAADSHSYHALLWQVGDSKGELHSFMCDPSFSASSREGGSPGVLISPIVRTASVLGLDAAHASPRAASTAALAGSGGTSTQRRVRGGGAVVSVAFPCGRGSRWCSGAAAAAAAASRTGGSAVAGGDATQRRRGSATACSSAACAALLVLDSRHEVSLWTADRARSGAVRSGSVTVGATCSLVLREHRGAASGGVVGDTSVVPSTRAVAVQWGGCGGDLVTIVDTHGAVCILDT